MFLLNLLILILSFMGFSLLIKDKFKIPTSFIPFIFIASLSTYVYIMACFSLMKEGVFIFHIGFMLVFLYYMLVNKKIILNLKDYWAFFLIAIFVVIYLYDKEFLHYDNFSHWGRIAKFLVENDRLNGTNDSYIIFNGYPQMSAYTIYGLIRPLGFRENFALIANAFALFSGYFILFKAFKKNIVSLIGFFIFSFYIFLDNTAIDTLLVDSLIAVIGFAGLIFSYDIDFNKNKRASFLLIPIISYLTLIKNSSIYFSLIVIIFLLIKYNIKNIKPLIISLLTMVFSYKSWSNHVKNTFPYLGKHSVNKESYEEIYKGKSIEDLNVIADKFKKAFLDERLVFVLIFLLLILYLILNRDKLIRNLLIASLLIFIVYEIGVYYMYLYSMPNGEALKLASYGRYSKTIRFYLLLFNFYLLVYRFNKSKLITSIVVIFIVFLSYKNFNKILKNDQENNYSLFVKHNLEDLSRKNEDDKSILIGVNDNKSYYYSFMADYIFDKSKTKVVDDISDENPNDYDYFIDLRKSEN